MSTPPATPFPATPSRVVEAGHCMGCGFCTVAIRGETPAATHLTFDEARDCFVPVPSRAAGEDAPAFVCPGAMMDMPALSLAKFGRQPEDVVLGIWKKLRVAYATDDRLRRQSASGGATRVLLRKLFDDGLIDEAYCAFAGASPYHSQGRLIQSVSDLDEAHGSHYHPVNFGAALAQLAQSGGRFAFVGLPCEIAGLEMLKRERPDIAARHVMSIGLFCGGINTFQGIAYYLKGFGLPWKTVETIEYRYGDWPGKIRLTQRGREDAAVVPRIRGNTRWKILRYVVAFQGYWMLQRCRMCPDQVADFADIAVGDPHLERFRAHKGEGFSLVVTRTERGEALVSRAIAANALAEEPITRDEAVASQGFTIENRRHVDVYRTIGRRLGMTFPAIQTYPPLLKSIRFHHRVFAAVDLLKIWLPKSVPVRVFYIPWQIFEYLFLTFAPRLIWRRLVGILRNR